jgi:hypothetical protein
MELVRPILSEFFILNVSLQKLFRDWAAIDDAQKHAGGFFLDYSEIPLLQQLNRNLLEFQEDEALLQQLRKNIKSAEELAAEIYLEALKYYPELKDENVDLSNSQAEHLKEFYDEFIVC